MKADLIRIIIELGDTVIKAKDVMARMIGERKQE
jgi:hypothetical protein